MQVLDWQGSTQRAARVMTASFCMWWFVGTSPRFCATWSSGEESQSPARKCSSSTKRDPNYSYSHWVFFRSRPGSDQTRSDHFVFVLLTWSFIRITVYLAVIRVDSNDVTLFNGKPNHQCFCCFPSTRIYALENLHRCLQVKKCKSKSYHLLTPSHWTKSENSFRLRPF
jgi:hypothetical protein